MTQTLDYAAQTAAAQKKAEAARVETRAALLTELRALGVALLEVQYEGYGDSGNVEDVTPTPTEIKLDTDLNRRVEDFAWDFAYALNPGFENNEGGYGSLEWNLETDKITISHSNRYVESDTTEYEDL